MRNGEYELVVAPDNYPGKKYRGKYCYEHALVWWRGTGKMPSNIELIHHINGNKRDNRLGNLEVLTVQEHNKYHSSGRTVVKLRCPNCGAIFCKERNKTHLTISTKTMDFCSRRCIGEFNFRSVTEEAKRLAIASNVIEVFLDHSWVS